MHVLRQQIARVRRQTRWLLVLHALGWMIGGAILISLALVLVDFLLRVEDRGFRIASTIALVCALAWTIYRYLLPAIRVPLDDVRLARRVEQRYPELTDRLSSSLNFLNQSEDDAQAGSSELRRAVIAEATAEVEHLNWSAVLDRRPTLIAMGLAGLVVLLATVLVVLCPGDVKVGLARLAWPFSDVAWPRDHQLALRAPVTRVATGQNFEVEVIDLNGELPDDLRIEFRYLIDGEPTSEEQERLVAVRGTAIARKEGVTKPFEYRAVGGDDHSMLWTAVEVLEPPRVDSVAITLHQPAYTGRLPQPSQRRIEALRGTAIVLEGRTTKRSVSARVRQENGPSIPLAIAEDGFGFRLKTGDAAPRVPDIQSAAADEAHEWIVDRSGKYWIELTDADGLVGGHYDAWDLKALADMPPQVAIERPVGTLFVTPQATARMRIVARDDLALHEVALQYVRSDQSDRGEQRVVVYSGPPSLGPEGRALDEAAELTNRTIEHDWELEPLGLRPGAQITATAAAVDYLPQTANSQPVRLVVLSSAEFEEHIASRQAALFAEIVRILRLQQETRAQTEELTRQAKRVGEFRKRDIDGVHTAELSQRQIRRSLASPSEGVVAQAKSLIEELHANRIDNPESHRRIEQIHEEIQRLDAAELASIEENLVRVAKSRQVASGNATDSDDSVFALVEPLQTAADAQNRVVLALEEILERLQEWTSFRAINRDIAQIQRDQAALESRARALQPATLGKQRRDLSGQEMADVDAMSSSQSELARRFDKLLQRMDQGQAELRQSTPLVADSLADAVQAARELGIASQMRDAARHVEGNQLGRTIEDQAEVGRKLAELIDMLSGQREHELARLVKKLRDAELQLEALRARQGALLKAARKARDGASTDPDGKQPDAVRQELQRLAREERQLKQDADRTARELERLRAERAAQTLAAASKKLDSASQTAGQGAAAKTADLAEDAKRDLDEAQRELAQERRQAEQDLANEQLASIRDSLLGLAGRQENIVKETKRMDGLRDDQGGLQPAHAQSVVQLAREQQTLHAESIDLSEKIASAAVFQLALRSAAEQMQQASDLLARQLTGDDTQRAVQFALARLQQLLAALDEDAKSSGESEPSNDGNSGSQPKLPPGQSLPSMAELKLLKVMQEDVYRRTTELRERLGERAPNADERRELEYLGQEQGQIAELVAKLSAKAAAARQRQPAIRDLEDLDGNKVDDGNLDRESKNADEPGKRD